jgi:hypothetical protein
MPFSRVRFRHPDQGVQPHELRVLFYSSNEHGLPPRVCIPHLGAKFVRKAQDEDEDDDDVARHGDVVDAFGHNASSRPQLGIGVRGKKDTPVITLRSS